MQLQYCNSGKDISRDGMLSHQKIEGNGWMHWKSCKGSVRYVAESGEQARLHHPKVREWAWIRQKAGSTHARYTTVNFDVTKRTYTRRNVVRLFLIMSLIFKAEGLEVCYMLHKCTVLYKQQYTHLQHIAYSREALFVVRDSCSLVEIYCLYLRMNPELL